MKNVSSYKKPPFIGIDEKVYLKWLQRKSTTHAKRDRERITDKFILSKNRISISEYKMKIHKAVCESLGKDFYTGEQLEWKKISKYDNELSKSKKVIYSREYYDLPTVDHNFAEGNIVFKICSWKTNNCKNSLTFQELIKFSKKIIKYQKNKKRT